jgi:hypothetical protein
LLFITHLPLHGGGLGLQDHTHAALLLSLYPLSDPSATQQSASLTVTLTRPMTWPLFTPKHSQPGNQHATHPDVSKYTVITCPPSHPCITSWTSSPSLNSSPPAASSS